MTLGNSSRKQQPHDANPFYRHRGWERYVLGLSFVLIAFSVRWFLQPVLQQHAPLILFILAAMLAALCGGTGPGVAAMVVGEFLGDFFFISPYSTFGPHGVIEWAYCLTFFAVTGIVILVVAALRRTRDRAEKSKSLAQQQSRQLQAAEQALQSRFEELQRAQRALRDQNEQLGASRTELEQRVRERTVELEAANREMEAFSYSVSHDLRAPVRSIRGFSQALLEDCGDKLDEEGQKYLQYVYEAGVRMGRLIDDLLGLAQASRGQLVYESVDLSALATDVVRGLQARDSKREVEVVVEQGLAAEGDEGLLRIALENLLGNAWKFTNRRAHAKIEMGVDDPNQPGQFFIRDNGAGFSMAQADRLFGVFQRLHSQEDFPGTGIGLATVQRIFSRHGGRIWGEGTPNQGAIFHFTLPRPAANLETPERQAA